MQATCDFCKREYTLSDTDVTRVENGKAKGLHAIFVKCTQCTMTTVVQWAEKPVKETPPLRCPVSACDGHVVHVTNDGPAYWGCGHCGSQWYDVAKLQQEITAIVKRFPYRKKSYRKAKGQWIAAGEEAEVEDYEDRVAEEPEDDTTEYRRS